MRKHPPRTPGRPAGRAAPPPPGLEQRRVTGRPRCRKDAPGWRREEPRHARARSAAFPRPRPQGLRARRKIPGGLEAAHRQPVAPAAPRDREGNGVLALGRRGAGGVTPKRASRPNLASRATAPGRPTHRSPSRGEEVLAGPQGSSDGLVGAGGAVSFGSSGSSRRRHGLRLPHQARTERSRRRRPPLELSGRPRSASRARRPACSALAPRSSRSAPLCRCSADAIPTEIAPRPPPPRAPPSRSHWLQARPAPHCGLLPAPLSSHLVSSHNASGRRVGKGRKELGEGDVASQREKEVCRPLYPGLERPGLKE